MTTWRSGPDGLVGVLMSLLFPKHIEDLEYRVYRYYPRGDEEITVRDGIAILEGLRALRRAHTARLAALWAPAVTLLVLLPHSAAGWALMGLPAIALWVIGIVDATGLMLAQKNISKCRSTIRQLAAEIPPGALTQATDAPTEGALTITDTETT